MIPRTQGMSVAQVSQNQSSTKPSQVLPNQPPSEPEVLPLSPPSHDTSNHSMPGQIQVPKPLSQLKKQSIIISKPNRPPTKSAPPPLIPVQQQIQTASFHSPSVT